MSRSGDQAQPRPLPPIPVVLAVARDLGGERLELAKTLHRHVQVVTLRLPGWEPDAGKTRALASLLRSTVALGYYLLRLRATAVLFWPEPQPWAGLRAALARALGKKVLSLPAIVPQAAGSIGDAAASGNALRETLAAALPELRVPAVRVELGCGSNGVGGTIGVDRRLTVRTSAVCDARHACFRSESVDEVYAYCVLEHFENPYEVMDEVVRILKPDGRAFLRVPNIGTYSAHLDNTHRFLGDLKVWRDVMSGYFASVAVAPIGTKYRDSLLLRAINRVLISVFGFKELAQGWTFVCARKHLSAGRGYVGWWLEQER